MKANQNVLDIYKEWKNTKKLDKQLLKFDIIPFSDDDGVDFWFCYSGTYNGKFVSGIDIVEYDEIDIEDFSDIKAKEMYHVLEKNIEKYLNKPNLSDAPRLVQKLCSIYTDNIMTFIDNDDDYLDFIEGYTEKEIQEANEYLSKIDDELGGGIIEGCFITKEEYLNEYQGTDIDTIITCYGNFETYFNGV